MNKPPVVNPAYSVEYSTINTPPTYVCHDCGAKNCKLWMDCRAPISEQVLLCANCAAKNQEREVSEMNRYGMYPSDFGLTNQIGCYVPAVPTKTNNGFCNYLALPQLGKEWWQRLPTFPEKR